MDDRCAKRRIPSLVILEQIHRIRPTLTKQRKVFVIGDMRTGVPHTQEADATITLVCLSHDIRQRRAQIVHQTLRF